MSGRRWRWSPQTASPLGSGAGLMSFTVFSASACPALCIDTLPSVCTSAHPFSRAGDSSDRVSSIAHSCTASVEKTSPSIKVPGPQNSPLQAAFLEVVQVSLCTHKQSAISLVGCHIRSLPTAAHLQSPSPEGNTGSEVAQNLLSFGCRTTGQSLLSAQFSQSTDSAAGTAPH